MGVSKETTIFIRPDLGLSQILDNDGEPQNDALC